MHGEETRWEIYSRAVKLSARNEVYLREQTLNPTSRFVSIILSSQCALLKQLAAQFEKPGIFNLEIFFDFQRDLPCSLARYTPPAISFSASTANSRIKTNFYGKKKEK